MKAQDLRELRAVDLRNELQGLLRAQLGARVRLTNQTLTNTASLRTLRGDIARVRTVLTEVARGIRRSAKEQEQE